MKNSETNTVVIGIDGAHFELLERWLAEGLLPSIQQSINSGVSGDLESVIPPVTSPNWKAYATGKNPGKLGLFWWENIDVSHRSIYYPNERKHTHTEYWELLAENERVGVIGVPTTYPPKEAGEFIVAGAPDGENTGFAYPNSVEEDLREKYDYRVVADYKIKEHRDRAAQELINLIDLRFEVALDLFDKYDLSFLQVTTFYINTLQHYFWDGEYTREAWENIDARIGEFLDRDINVVLMSDHGSTRIDYNFHINPWLEREGYLSTDVGVSRYLHRLGLTTNRLGRIVSTLGIRNAVVNSVPDSILRRIPSDSGEVSRNGKGAAIDWDASSAVASGQGPVYLIPDDGDNEQLREELIGKLKQIRTPNNQHIASAVHRVEDVYSGPYIDEAPDILIEQRDGIHIPGDIGRGEIFSQSSSEKWVAENKRHGLFVASGPDFGSGEIDNMSILDLAPTLLHLYGQRVPSDMDGAVRKDVFAEHNPARERPVKQTVGDRVSIKTDESERDEAVTDRLEDLGYL